MKSIIISVPCLILLLLMIFSPLFSVDHLTEDVIVKAIRSSLKSTKNNSEDVLNSKRTQVAEHERNLTGLPRNTLTATARKLEHHYQLPQSSVDTSILRSNIALHAQPVQYYHDAVKANFDRIWVKSVAKETSLSLIIPENAPSGGQSADTKTEPETRTVSVTLDHILRSDFSDDDKVNIKHLLQQKQGCLFRHMDEIQLALMKVQLEVSDFALKERMG